MKAIFEGTIEEIVEQMEKALPQLKKGALTKSEARLSTSGEERPRAKKSACKFCGIFSGKMHEKFCKKNPERKPHWTETDPERFAKIRAKSSRRASQLSPGQSTFESSVPMRRDPEDGDDDSYF